ncbi:MAG TPA: cbb3-type cytochrome oxidase assembly protein CcoS [Candidatus Obscuribacterales bacterium]
MCPNCILNQVGVSPGLIVAFAVCILFFVIGVAGVLWAFRNGEFEDMEAVKFDMLDDGDDNAIGERARKASEKLRMAALKK